MNKNKLFSTSTDKLLGIECLKRKSLGRTGMLVPQLAYGTVQLGLVDFDSPEETEAIEVILQAVKHGINYIDTAPWYGFGKAEVVLGKALKQLPRSSYYLATKVGRYHPEYSQMFDFSYERTLTSVEDSLKKLGIDYIDLIQVHDVEFAPSIEIILEETLPALQKVVSEGKAKFIGITGYPLEKLKEVVLKSTVPIHVVLSYSRWNLFDRTLQEYTTFFREQGIGIINAAFLGMGLLTPLPPPKWHPAGEAVRSLCQRAIDYCQKEDVDISKLATCFVLRSNLADTNIVGFNSMELLQKTLATLKDDLKEKEEKALQELLEKYFVSNNHWEGVEVAKYWSRIRK